MSAKVVPEWKRIHRESKIVDLHAHPSLKASLFKRALTSTMKASRAFDPLSVRTDFKKLKAGAVDVLLSSVYAPEEGIYRECPYLKALRYLMPITWGRVFSKSRFDVTMAMIDRMEAQVEKAIERKSGKRLAEMVYSVPALDELLAQDGERPTAIVHNIEGAHSLDGDLENLQKVFDRGVA